MHFFLFLHFLSLSAPLKYTFFVPFSTQPLGHFALSTAFLNVSPRAPAAPSHSLGPSIGKSQVPLLMVVNPDGAAWSLAH